LKELIENQAPIIRKRSSDWDARCITRGIYEIICRDKGGLGWAIQIPYSTVLHEMTTEYVCQLHREGLT
jgi:hypothetical protein